MGHDKDSKQNVEIVTEQTIEIVRSAGGEFIQGYAVVWYNPQDEGTVYRMTDNIEERVAPNAFDSFLRSGQPVKAYYNHSEHFELGSTENQTLFLTPDEKGLKFSIPYDADDPDHQKVKAKLRKQTAKGCSFAADGKVKIKRQDKKYVRTISEITSCDHIAIVNKPAYTGTSAIVRSEIEEYEEEQSRFFMATEIAKRLQAALK